MNTSIQNQNFVSMIVLTVVVAAVSIVGTVMVMNINRRNYQENYLLTTTQSTASLEMLNVMEKQAKGVRNASEDLGELTSSMDRPVLDLNQFLPTNR